MKDIVIAGTIGSGEDLFFTRCQYLIIDIFRNSVAEKILETEVDARRSAFGNNPSGEFCQVSGNDIQPLPHSIGIFPYEAAQPGIALSNIREHELHGRTGAEEVIKHSHVIAILAGQSPGIGNLCRKPRIIIRKRLDLFEVSSVFYIECCSIFIREKSIGHDFYKIRLHRFDVFRLSRIELFYQFRVLERIGMDFISQEMEPESRRDPVYGLVVHSGQY